MPSDDEPALRAEPGTTVLVENTFTGKCTEATANVSGHLQDEEGRLFPTSTHRIAANPES